MHSTKRSAPNPSSTPLLSVRRIKLSFIVFFTTILAVSAIGIAFQVYQDKTSQVTLTNYSSFLPGSYRSEIQSVLFNILKKSSPSASFPKGKIRDESFVALTDQGTTTASFLVDIDDYRQTFLVSYSFLENSKSDPEKNTILVSCPSKDKRKFPDSSCIGMYNTSAQADALSAVSAIASQLPIIVDDFNFASRTAIHYEILGHLNGENDYVITINDYSGDNRASALEKLSTLGISEENYKILYYDLSTPDLR